MSQSSDFIQRVPVLASCGIYDHQSFVEMVERKFYDANEAIIVEGQTDLALWMILSGTCEVVKGEPQNTTQKLAVLETGSMFGEISFFHPAPHSATVKAIGRVEVGRLSPENFRTLQERHPQTACCIITNLVSLLGDRLRRMDSQILDILAESAAHRQEEWQDFRARLFATSDFI